MADSPTIGDTGICRNCVKPITYKTVERRPDRQPTDGWSDGHRVDELVCFKAVSYRHVPLAGRELACYEAGFKAGQAATR